MNDLYITHEMWMICLTYKNYVHGNLPEDQELDGNVGNLTRLILV